MLSLSLEFAWLLFSGGLLMLVTGIAMARLGRRGPAQVRGCPIALMHLLGAALVAVLVDWTLDQQFPWQLRLVAQSLAAIGYLRIVGGRFAWFQPGLLRRRWSWAIRIWIAALPGLFGLIRINNYLFEHVFEGHAGNRLAQDFGDLPLAEMLWTLPIIVLIMPLLEEVLFRGYLFRMLISAKSKTASKHRFSALGATLASSFIFALAHDPGMWLPAFYLGIVLAWVDWRSADLRLCMFVHGIHNAVLLAVA